MYSIKQSSNLATIVLLYYSAYLGMARHQLREMVTERKGTEGKSGVAEAINEGNKLTLYYVKLATL